MAPPNTIDPPNSAAAAGRKRKRPQSTTEDVREKLQLARAKLQGAMQKRDRAMQRLSPVHGGASPISALSSNLAIENISTSGPRDKVFFPTETLAADLGRAELERDVGGNYTSNSLAEKKNRLQRELQILKERLELHQRKEGGDHAPMELSATTAKNPFTKEELEKKKGEAQINMDISHWRHFVSKQENMFEEANERVSENRRALAECELEQQTTEHELRAAQQESNDLDVTNKAVIDLLKTATCKVFQTRTALYTAKEGASAK